jgi:hypothetical protein
MPLSDYRPVPEEYIDIERLPPDPYQLIYDHVLLTFNLCNWNRFVK